MTANDPGSNSFWASPDTTPLEKAASDAPPAASADAVDGAKREYDGKPAADAAPAAGAAAPQPADLFHAPPPAVPTQAGPLGILYDFNDGARVLLPKGQWRVHITDEDSGNILFACDADEGWVVSARKYYVPFGIKVWVRGEPEPVLDHVMNLKDRQVLLKFPVGTLGDLIGWFPYSERFLEKHECVLECVMGRNLIDIFKDQYPGMTFSDPLGVRMKEPYASYRIGLFFGGNRDCQPIDFRMVGLHRTAGHILGVDPAELPPRLNLKAPRRIADRYVAIAVQSSCQAKYWNNGHGWPTVVDHLKSLGYRVLCIDRQRTVGMGYTWNHLPYGAEDFTGDLPLQERIDVIKDADFFVGLSSGLAWLAWACRVPVVMVSGFTLPICEFNTPYRVYSTHGCMGCWDDTTVMFDHKDFFWCPRHKGTDRQYECSRLITGRQAVNAIERLRRDYSLAAPNGEERRMPDL
ncbi:MAG: autotransporter strand-loop-strand O-heptosyltransferase [Planctomycetota bacterium]|jgi:autotransporter strand-loop-strand O-heptosyltransferase|nr:autotransporter strand-loop-strand O-heptosyltransferase [Planctomycetota bacterium]